MAPKQQKPDTEEDLERRLAAKRKEWNEQLETSREVYLLALPGSSDQDVQHSAGHKQINQAFQEEIGQLEHRLKKLKTLHATKIQVHEPFHAAGARHILLLTDSDDSDLEIPLLKKPGTPSKNIESTSDDDEELSKSETESCREGAKEQAPEGA